MVPVTVVYFSSGHSLGRRRNQNWELQISFLESSLRPRRLDIKNWNESELERARGECGENFPDIKYSVTRSGK